MGRNLQANFDIDGVSCTRVVRFEERQRLGRPPVLDIEVRYAGYIGLSAMLGHPARLVYGFEGEATHIFTGIVEEACAIGSSISADGVHAYRLRIVPALALLDRDVDSRIFQQMDVKEVVELLLGERAIKMEWRLAESYPKRTYCVQYQESRLGFIHRLLGVVGGIAHRLSGVLGQLLRFGGGLLRLLFHRFACIVHLSASVFGRVVLATRQYQHHGRHSAGQGQTTKHSLLHEAPPGEKFVTSPFTLE